MAKKDDTTEVTKRKRTTLTPEERIAKLEADLEAARAKAKERADKEGNKLQEQRAALVTRREGIDVKIKAIDVQLEQLGMLTTPTTEGE